MCTQCEVNATFWSNIFKPLCNKAYKDTPLPVEGIVTIWASLCSHKINTQPLCYWHFVAAFWDKPSIKSPTDTLTKNETGITTLLYSPPVWVITAIHGKMQFNSRHAENGESYSIKSSRVQPTYNEHIGKCQSFCYIHLSLYLNIK